MKLTKAETPAPRTAPDDTAARMYAVYWERKRLNTAVPPPSWVQCDDIERASWIACAEAALQAVSPTDPPPE